MDTSVPSRWLEAGAVAAPSALRRPGLEWRSLLEPAAAVPRALAPTAGHGKVGCGQTTAKEDGGNGLIFSGRRRSWLDLVSVPYGGSYPEDFLHYMTTLSRDPRWKHRPPWNTHTQLLKRGIQWIRLHGRTLFFLSSCNMIRYHKVASHKAVKAGMFVPWEFHS